MTNDVLHADVMVVGAGVAGVIAAIAARRAGANVLVVEAHSYPGGMANQAMVQPYQTFHSPRGQIIRGIPQEYVNRMIEHGGSLGHKLDPLGFATTVTPMDDRVSRHVMLEWLIEEDIDLLLNTAVVDVRMSGSRIETVKLATLDQSKMQDGIPFGHWQINSTPIVQEWTVGSRAVVDATGCASVARRCGVMCEMSYARQPMSWLFALGGINERELRDYVDDNPQDFILSNDERAKEDDYLAACGFFSLIREAAAEGDWQLPRDRLLFFGTPNKGEVTVNTTRIPHDFGSDSEIVSEGLRQIEFLVDFFRKRVPGCNKSVLTRKADRIGVRESYRIVGRYVMTRGDVVNGARFDDVIALGAFPVDIHSSMSDDLDTEKVGERGHYDIPLRSLLTNEVGNLVLAGRHISVSHEAFASTRVMPTAMAIGQAAGAAATVIANRLSRHHPIAFDDEQTFGALYVETRKLLDESDAILSDEQVEC